MMATTLEVQRRLKPLGFDPGPLDGIPGRRTIAAIRAFQAAHGLAPDGLAGPATVAALSGSGGEGGVEAAPWYEEAERHLGLRERAGPKHNPEIIGWLERLKAPWRDDETPWCGTFVGWCIAATLPDELLPANPFGARSWLTFGAACEPRRAAVLVFSRPGSAWSGHVGFYSGEDEGAFHVLGGNQSDAVTTARIAKPRLLGARWPKSARRPSGGRIRATASHPLSSNEA
jgi:uncharacterized protein (TIGR02594 family)